MSEDAASEAEVKAFRVTGRVQGVGFRWWTRRTAEELGLAGSVRNCRDGSVEVKASGRSEDLARLADALERGPTSARVASVEAMDPDPNIPRKGFHIDR